MRSAALACLSGAAAASPFIAFATYPLVFLAFIPLLLAIRDTSVGKALALGWLTGVCGQLLAFSWVVAAIARFEEISLWSAAPLFAIFLAYHGFQFGLFAGALSALVPAGMPRRAGWVGYCLLTASLWVLLEWGYPKVFTWSFGAVLVESRLLRQGADLIGVYGLSFVILLVNGAIAAAFMASPARPLQRARSLGAAVSLIAALLA